MGEWGTAEEHAYPACPERKAQGKKMREKRSIRIDLHRRRFTGCIRLEDGRNYPSEWSLWQWPQFLKNLRRTDETSVEETGNRRLFCKAVAPYVPRVVVIDLEFRVISHLVKKRDSHDARNLALYLAKGPVPEVRMKEKEQAEMASLSQTRDPLVKLRTALKNKVKNLLPARGIELQKESLSSEKGLTWVLRQKIGPGGIVEQIRSFRSIARLERAIEEASQKLKGHPNWILEDFPNFVLAEAKT